MNSGQFEKHDFFWPMATRFFAMIRAGFGAFFAEIECQYRFGTRPEMVTLERGEVHNVPPFTAAKA